MPPPTPAGLAWSALGLKVPNPGRPHRLTVTVTGGHPSALGVALVDSGGGRGRPRVVLDACASGPPILEADAGRLVLLAGLARRRRPGPGPGQPRCGRAGAARDRLADRTGPASPRRRRSRRRPDPEQARVSACDLAGPERSTVWRWGGRPGDPLATCPLNLARYLAHCGASTVVLPEGLADRSRRGPSTARPRGCRSVPTASICCSGSWAARDAPPGWNWRLEGPLPGLPPPDSAEALAKGLVRVDRRGLADGPAYHPLHPEVREALKRRVAEAVSPRKSRPPWPACLIRLGPGPTLLGGPDTGLDDATFARFVRETFERRDRSRGARAWGRPTPGRFAARSPVPGRPGPDALVDLALPRDRRRSTPSWPRPPSAPPPARSWPWRPPASTTARPATRPVGSTWPGWPPARPGAPSGSTSRPGPRAKRSRSSSVASASRPTTCRTTWPPAPNSMLTVIARAGAGTAASASKNQARAPAGPRPTRQARGRPRVASRPPCRWPRGRAGDESMGHALAALDARWVDAVGDGRRRPGGASPPVRPRLPRLPRLGGAGPCPWTGSRSAWRSGRIAVGAFDLSWRWPTTRPTRSGSRRCWPPSLAPVDDLGRGLRLVPEAVAGREAGWCSTCPPSASPRSESGSPKVKVGSVTPYPSEAVLAGMKARYDELSGQLSRLNRPSRREESSPGPPNPGFEPAPAPRGPAGRLDEPPRLPAAGRSSATPASAVEIDSEQPHSGRGSLRLDARRRPPRPSVSDGFPAEGSADPDGPGLVPLRPPRCEGPGLDRRRRRRASPIAAGRS